MPRGRNKKGQFVEDTMRSEAKAAGQKHYQGHDCKHGHGGIRFVSNNGCVECLKIQNRKYYHANKETQRERFRDYAKSDPIGNALRSSRYFKRKSEAKGSHTKQDVLRLIAESRNKCHWCGDELGEYHLDHKIPLSRGGSNEPENLCVCCPTCNLSKGNKLPSEWRGK